MNKRILVIAAANEFRVENNCLKIPFGTYEHIKGLQIFGKTEAEGCIAVFNEESAIPNFNGLPIYIGHPDVKSFQDKYRDHAAYGWIKTMLVNEAESRLELHVQWTKPGAELIANEQFVYFSPHWLADKHSGTIHPYKIKSVGLTQEPNIRYLAIACEEQEGNIMNLLERLKALLPQTVAEGIASEDDAVSFFQKMLDGLRALRESEKAKWEAESAAYTALENESDVEALKQYIVALENEVPADTAATLGQVKTELQVANESLGTLKKSHAALLLDQALLDGRVTPATRAKWDARFGEEDFTAVANELAAIDPAMKTASVLGKIKRTDHGGATHKDVIDCANELAKDGRTFTDAYAIAKRRKEFAHIFPDKK